MEKLFPIKEQLEKNNFEVYLAENRSSAKLIFQEQIFPKLNVQTVSYADSITMQACNVLESLRNNANIEFIETFNQSESREQRILHRKKALTVDLFLTGTNALTKHGQLINLDMVGNRVAAMNFGPRNVALFIGKNKIVENIDAAMQRIKTVSAPMNARRHTEFEIPCQKTGKCHNCNSPQRICNVWTITEKSYPKGRIKIILINEELGY